jgi:hypothetical protein
MLPGGKQPLTKSSRRARRLECGSNASCKRESSSKKSLCFLVETGWAIQSALGGGGHRQHGLDFEDKFAPVCSYWTMRMILAAV